MDKERAFWMLIRQALLMFVDAIELYKIDVPMRTSEIRKIYKQNVIQ